MKKICISSILDYGRWYDGCSFDDGLPYFFLDLDDLEICDRDTLIREYGLDSEILSDETALYYTYRFIPVFHVNIIAEIRRFFENMNNRQISKEIKDLNPDQLHIYFNKHMELNWGDSRRWYEHEKQCLTAAAIDWCKQFHIPYVINY